MDQSVTQFTQSPQVQAAIITACIMLVTFISTQLINFFTNRSYRKRETRVKFFYEMYPKRLAVYDEVDDLLTEICQNSSKLNKLDRTNASEVIHSYIYNLKRLSHRLSIYGSVETWGIIGELSGEIRELSLKYLEFDVDAVTPRKITKFSDEVALAEFILNTASAVNAAYRVFTDSVMAEGSGDFIDKEITDFFKNTVLNKKKRKAKDNIN